MSDTSVRINAVVGLGSSGSVSVTNSVGTASKSGFTYFSNAPIITSFTPSTGTSGTGVIIRGTNFNSTNSVKFNNIETTFTVDSASKITTTVPGGATSGIISVTLPDGIGSSSTNIIVNTSASGTINICPGGNGVASLNISGSSYQWQVQSDSGFINLSNSTNYAGVDTIDLQLNAVPTSWYGKKYRCIVNGTNVSNTFTIVISNNWTGSSGLDWETGNNWGCSQTVSDANTDVTISSGTVILSSNVLVKSINVLPGATLVVKSGYTLTIKK
ncbi:MAG: hypothetical protein LH478_06915 [Chitinophagaceae bacterium]|nr:hypothetical protein [Chitinophagaceae bacterium]